MRSWIVLIFFCELALATDIPGLTERRVKKGRRREREKTKEKPDKSARLLKKLRKQLSEQAKILRNLQNTVDSSSLKIHDLDSTILQLSSERRNMTREFEHIRQERSFVDARLSFLEQKATDLQILQAKFDILEQDNHRIKLRNEALYDELFERRGNNDISRPKPEVITVNGHNGGNLQFSRNLRAERVPEIERTMTLEIATPKSVIVTGGRRHGVALNHVKLVSPNFVVTELDPLPSPLIQHCSCSFNGQIFLIGGTAGVGFPRREVFVLNHGRSWSNAPDLQFPRTKLGCVNFADRLFAIGGNSGSNAAGVLSSSEYLGIFSGNQWKTGPTLLSRRYDAPAVSFDNVVYVIGGKNDKGEILQSTEKLSFHKNAKRMRFSKGPVLPLLLEGVAATRIDDKIFVSGHCMSTQTTRVLELAINSWDWKAVGDLRSPRVSPSLVTVGQSLWFLGGCCGKMASLEEIYVSREGIKSTSKDIQLEELQEIYEFSATYII